MISEAGLDQLEKKNEIDLSKVTHQLVDRPVLKNKVPGRTYVQPQWIFDCINRSDLLPANLYLPGESLPPHLSPWGDSVGYNPDEEEEAEGESDAESEVEEEAEDQVEVAKEEESEDEDLANQKELELEAQGVKYSEAPKESSKPSSKKRKAVSEEEEEKRLKMIMMSNKQRKLYKKTKYSNEKKDDRVKDLKKKKKQLSKANGKLKNLDRK